MTVSTFFPIAVSNSYIYGCVGQMAENTDSNVLLRIR